MSFRNTSGCIILFLSQEFVAEHHNIQICYINAPKESILGQTVFLLFEIELTKQMYLMAWI